MKKILEILFLICFLNCLSAYADTTQVQTQPQQVVTSVPFSACQKTYEKPSEPFFYLLLSSIAKNNYKIEEIQSQNGLVIFKAYNKEFLANVTQINSKTTLLKITPTDNNYTFSYYLVDNLFKVINTDFEQNIYKLN